MALPSSVYLNLDDAWAHPASGLTTRDARLWGPQLRFSAPPRLIEKFFREEVSQLPPFVLYGSGDFHHLTALWIRKTEEPLVVVSFDNHPDWDIRPPRWCCGGWVNRALELPQVEKVSVWGCGNFECWWPGQAFGNRRAERAGTLEVRAWADDRPAGKQQRRGAIFRASWRQEFERFAAGIAQKNVYVTIDLDCLEASAAITNWENGKFSVDDVAWALRVLREQARVIAGDICGAYSRPNYARMKQRFVATIDHPKIAPVNVAHAQEVNSASLARVWPILTEGHERHSGGDQD